MGISTVSGYGNQALSPSASQARSGTPVAAPQTQASQPQATHAPTTQEVQEAVNEMVKVVQPKANNLQFSIDQSTGKTIVRVTDSSTGDLVRQIPSEEVLDIAKNIERMQSLLMRQKA